MIVESTDSEDEEERQTQKRRNPQAVEQHEGEIFKFLQDKLASYQVSEDYMEI